MMETNISQNFAQKFLINDLAISLVVYIAMLMKSIERILIKNCSGLKYIKMTRDGIGLILKHFTIQNAPIILYYIIQMVSRKKLGKT